MHCEFEPTIKIDCVKEIIALVKAGEAGSGQIATAVEHASCFCGCAAALYLTTINADDDTPPIFSAVPPLSPDCSIDDCCDEIDKCCEALSLKGSDDLSAIDWGSVMSLVSMVWTLIQKWRSKTPV